MIGSRFRPPCLRLLNTPSGCALRRGNTRCGLASRAIRKDIRCCRSNLATTKPSPPLLPLPATIKTPLLRGFDETLKNGLNNPLSGALHQRKARSAILLDRQSIHLAHLLGGYYDHN